MTDSDVLARGIEPVVPLLLSLLRLCLGRLPSPERGEQPLDCLRNGLLEFPLERLLLELEAGKGHGIGDMPKEILSLGTDETIAGASLPGEELAVLFESTAIRGSSRESGQQR